MHKATAMPRRPHVFALVQHWSCCKLQRGQKARSLDVNRQIEPAKTCSSLQGNGL